MDAQATPSRLSRLVHHAVVAALALLITAILWQAYGDWLMSPRIDVVLD
ncbi:MAG TPA: hypothetical protein VFV88_15275 [Steroidobacteraceae bacterium]|jgi:hypothetical protein|nr:hypothetical protein [Steroidobacteraceae bacterium]